MHFTTFSTATTFLCAALTVRTVSALPIAGDVRVLAPRVVVTDACVSIINRLPSVQGNVATACMEELAKHIFIGGNVNKLASSDGTHLASAFLPIFPSETLTNIDEKTLIAKPAKSDGTKTLWLDDGLLRLLTTAQTAQQDLQKEVTALETIQQEVKARQKNIAETQGKVEKNKLTIVKSLQNKAKNQQEVVDKAALKPKDDAIIKLAQSVDFVARKGELYSQTNIKAMCVDAMKQSLRVNNGRLLGGNFIVDAPNLRSGVKTITIRLFQGKEKDTPQRPRINSCFPVLT